MAKVPFKVGMAQILVESSQPQANLQRAVLSLAGLVVLAFCLIAEPVVAAQEQKPVPIRILGAMTLTGDPIPAERIPVGEDDDYKPSLGLLPNGELLLTAFHQHKQPGNKVLEQNLLFRSRDGGKTWSKAEKLELLGREPYLTVLRDGAIFITGHLRALPIINRVRRRHAQEAGRRGAALGVSGHLQQQGRGRRCATAPAGRRCAGCSRARTFPSCPRNRACASWCKSACRARWRRMSRRGRLCCGIDATREPTSAG